MELSNSEYEKEKMAERLAKLATGVAVIKVWILHHYLNPAPCCANGPVFAGNIARGAKSELHFLE